jgi:acetyl-CoA carboxylase biotin carboxyl carrier protein
MAGTRRRGKAANGVKPVKPVKSRNAGSDNATGDSVGGFELREIRRLIRLVQRTGIGELEVSSGDRTVRISAVTAMPVVHAPAARAVESPGADESAAKGARAQAAATENLVAVTSPMVGTFYRAPAPDADPYVEVGDTVEVGQTICIVEAMKLMNEIECETRGRVAKILVENSQAVEFGQKLFLLEPL